MDEAHLALYGLPPVLFTLTVHYFLAGTGKKSTINE